MRRFVIAAAVGSLALLVLVAPVAGGVLWCAKDPIVRLNGTDVQIWVAIPDQYQSLVTGPIDVEVKTPRGVTRDVVYLDAGFNDHGETVRFSDLKGGVAKDGSFTTEIIATVPIDKSEADGGPVALRLTIIPSNGSTVEIYGTTDGTKAKLTITGTP